MHTFWQGIFGTKLPTVEYCEQATYSIIARPGYFISNFVYILLGFYFLSQPGKLAKSFGLISIVVGIFSAIYDASFLFYAQILDLSAMAILVLFLLGLNFNKLNLLNHKKIISLLSILLITYMAVILLLEGQSGRIMFGIFVLGVIMTDYLCLKTNPQKDKKYFLLALFLFLLGFLIWMVDATQTICSPIEYLNGRSIYHYLTALSIFYLYKYNSKT